MLGAVGDLAVIERKGLGGGLSLARTEDLLVRVYQTDTVQEDPIKIDELACFLMAGYETAQARFANWAAIDRKSMVFLCFQPRCALHWRAQPEYNYKGIFALPYYHRSSRSLVISANARQPQVTALDL